MVMVYISLIALFSFAFSIFIVVLGEEVGIWASIVFFIATAALSWQIVKKALSRY